MSSAFRVSLDGLTELRRRLERLGAAMPRVTTRAINYAGGKARTRAVNDIAADIGGAITKTAIRRSVHFDRATFRDLLGQLRIGGYLRDDGQMPHPQGRIPVRHLGALQLPRGVQAGRKFYRSAFLRTMRSGHEGVFKRMRPAERSTPASRRSPNLPIDELFGPSPQQIFRNKFIAAAVAAGREDLVREAERQMALLLSGGQLPGAQPAV
jgi:hypothetical protein